METVKLLMLLVFFSTCKQKKVSVNQDLLPNVHKSVNKDSLRLVYFFGDGFLKNSCLKIMHDSILFIHDDIYMHPGIHNQKLLFFDKSSNRFKYQSSVHSELSDDSLKLLRKNNLIRQILKENRGMQRRYYNEIIKNESLKPKITFLKKDVRINFFDKKYYVVTRSAPDSLFQVDLDKQTVNAFVIKDRPLDAMGILLFDIDKDENPEIILFHENMVLQKERLLYNVYSLRYDNIKVVFVQKN